MLYARACEVMLQRAVHIAKIQIVNEPPSPFRLMETHSMNSLLEIDTFVVWPDRCSAGIAPFADQNVAFDGSIPLLFFILEPHFKNVAQIEVKPTNIQVAQIRLRGATIFGFVQHLSKALVGDLLKRSNCPSLSHSIAPMPERISALSASKDTIS